MSIVTAQFDMYYNKYILELLTSRRPSLMVLDLQSHAVSCKRLLTDRKPSPKWTMWSGVCKIWEHDRLYATQWHFILKLPYFF